ncbi:MAG: hypothetical protein KUG77_24830, partial [Nannocystaceae bacterium]|nr:hypothetical protein [Nannocystaceae bacterium]
RDRREGGIVDTHIHFPMTDDRGRALSIRLLCVPFRLPSAAIGLLNHPNMVKGVIDTIAPLWTWTNGDDPDSPVHSSDGYSLKVEPLWKPLPGTKEPAPVWVGSDPFAISERQSNLFVRKRRKFAEIYEPADAAGQKKLSKMMLGQAIYEALVLPDAARDTYGSSIDIARLNRELKTWDDERSEMRVSYEKSARMLSKHVLSPMFALLQGASLEAEGFEDADDYHEALLEHMRVLDVVTRNLSDCTAGLELLLRWATEAEKSEHHFINKVVLPTRFPPLHILKTFRWGSKSAINVLRKLAPIVAKGKSDLAKKVTEAFVNMGIAKNADAVKDALGKVKLKASDFGDAMGVHLKRGEVIDAKAFGRKMAAELEAFLGADGTKAVKAAATEYRTPAFLSVLTLDVVNVALALSAIRDAKGEEAVLRASASGGAAFGFLVAGFVKPIVDHLPDTNPAKARYMRGVLATQAAAGLVYMTLNFIAASEALDKDDNDRAAALLVAGVAELVASATYIAMLWNPLAVAPPYLLAVSLVAAAAYIAATVLTDDPLERFLENCEWGSNPYGESDYHPEWSNVAVSAWKGDFNLQSKLFLRVLARLTIEWDLKRWPASTISINLNRDGMRVEAEFFGVTYDKIVHKEEQVFKRGSLPKAVPVEFNVKPKTRYLDIPGIDRLYLTIRLTAQRGADEDFVRVLLMEDGKGITSGSKSRVS